MARVSSYGPDYAMTPFELVAILMALVALAGWLNAKTLHLPHGVAMLIAGLIGALLLVGADRISPDFAGVDQITGVINGIDFTSTVTGYMLAFLLFAGAMQVDLHEIRRRWVSITLLSTLGVAASVLIIGLGLWGLSSILGIQLSLPWALVFGALISPTDPVAVLASLRHVQLPKTLTAVLQGEALFNDGVGIVAFTALVAVAMGVGDVSPVHAVFDILIEAVGGLVLGLAAGAVVIRAMGTLDEFAVEVSMSIALAMGVYAGAQALHLSGPIAAVGAGMLFGGERAKHAMSGETETYLKSFWTLIDEILNALLFLLLGVELVTVPMVLGQIPLMIGAIGLVLLARFVVVAPSGAYYRHREGEKGATPILWWGGLHGALSLALALSLPDGPERRLILELTYVVVAFSVAFQGLTFTQLVRRATSRAHADVH